MYAQIRIYEKDHKEIMDIVKAKNAEPGPNYSASSVFHEMLDAWKKLHCPECGAEIQTQNHTCGSGW